MIFHYSEKVKRFIEENLPPSQEISVQEISEKTGLEVKNCGSQYVLSESAEKQIIIAQKPQMGAEYKIDNITISVSEITYMPVLTGDWVAEESLVGLINEITAKYLEIYRVPFPEPVVYIPICTDNTHVYVVFLSESEEAATKPIAAASEKVFKF